MGNPHVSISGTGTQLSVVPSDAPISKSAAEEILWTSNIQGKTCTITFTNSPFNSSTFPVDTTGTTGSGPVRSNAPTGDYKYSVSCPGFSNLDPNVIVKN
jgi:hypothetical protein